MPLRRISVVPTAQREALGSLQVAQHACAGERQLQICQGLAAGTRADAAIHGVGA